MEGFFDSVTTPYSAINPGNTASVSLVHGGTGKTLTATIRFSQAASKLEANGVVSWTATGQSTGAFSLPT